MNDLREIQESIQNFILEKAQMQKQIQELEEKRTQLAQERNEKKKHNIDVNQLGKQISELGNQSQELQNKLDFKYYEIKAQNNYRIDNSIAELIRNVRKIDGEIQYLEQEIEKQKEKNTKYEFQRQEFYYRFGRLPELSENAKNKYKKQQETMKRNALNIKELNCQIECIQEQIKELVKIKNAIKDKQWNSIINKNEEPEIDEIQIEPLIIKEIEPIEEIIIENFEEVEELYVEEFSPIEELNINYFEENVPEKLENNVDEIEELAKAIVEEIVIEQTKDIEINEIEEKESKKEKTIIPLFGQKASISNIIVKFEERQLIYKAQMSDGEEIKICPSQLSLENVLLRDKQNREECKEILINYAISEYKTLDKKVITKIDPLVCELLIVCAEKYKLNAQELIYNYAMSFSKNGEIELDNVPGIIYNLTYIEESELNRKEKAIINKICKNARKNSRIEVIESFTGFKKIKYVLKKIFTVNNIKVLPEAKY